jgi:hypothetical protein
VLQFAVWCATFFGHRVSGLAQPRRRALFQLGAWDRYATHVAFNYMPTFDIFKVVNRLSDEAEVKGKYEVTRVKETVIG